MIQGRQALAAQGLFRPTLKDWRVRLVFIDGTERVVRITPGVVSEEVAVLRAKRHAKIFDETILKTVETSRAESSDLVKGPSVITK